jgi:hypothetical protein
MITGVPWFYFFSLEVQLQWVKFFTRDMELRLNFCWRFNPLAIHSYWNETERINKNQTILFPWEAEGTHCCPEKKQAK